MTQPTGKVAEVPHAALLVDQLLQTLQIKQWDALIVGDGSGNSWHTACGWASIIVDRISGNRELFYGAISRGSINMAETLPYLQALTWYDDQVGKAMLDARTRVDIAVVTDSRVVQTWGNRATDLAHCPRKLRTLWFALAGLREAGYVIKFYWLPRASSHLNIQADLIAGLAREGLNVVNASNAAAQAAIAQRAMLQLSKLDTTRLQLNV